MTTLIQGPTEPTKSMRSVTLPREKKKRLKRKKERRAKLEERKNT